MIKLGDYNKMTVVKEVDFGIYLDGGDEGEILMPKRYVPEGTKPGDELEVFIYLDQDERPVATTEHPLCKVGDFAYLEVSWVNEYGAFLNWGLMKDLFCPFREQKKRMQKGESYIVHVHIDEESYRIVASAKVERYFAERHPFYNHGQEVDLLVWQKTEMGFKVIIDNCYPGLVYEIDVTLQPTGRQQTLDFSETLLQYLRDNGGKCDLGDKSDAEDIKRRFQVSKKVYKRAIGDLYKRRLIEVGDNGIKLIG